MDGLTAPITGRRSYRTPVSILVPKLVQSRDNWKAKSDRRKHQLKLAKLTIRDLSLSRDSWREKYQQLQQQNHNLQRQTRTDSVPTRSRSGRPCRSTRG